MNKSILTAMIFAAFAVPSLTLAQSTPRTDQRQENQEKRIEQGVKSGELNKKETARLEKGQQRVQKIENQATSDGKVTNKEKAHMEHAQDNQSKHIYHQKHDKQQAKQ